MEFLTLSDFQGNDHPAVYSDSAAEADRLLEAAQDGLWILADWPEDPADSQLLSLAPLGSRLLIPERWQRVLPDAALLISSAISGGWLRQRFLELAHRRCWLVLEPMQHRFPLPCPNGQGQWIDRLPTATTFYAEALCCRYCHTPGELFLFDTEETLLKKRQLAEECGFAGCWAKSGSTD